MVYFGQFLLRFGTTIGCAEPTGTTISPFVMNITFTFACVSVKLTARWLTKRYLLGVLALSRRPRTRLGHH